VTNGGGEELKVANDPGVVSHVGGKSRTEHCLSHLEMGTAQKKRPGSIEGLRRNQVPQRGSTRDGTPLSVTAPTDISTKPMLTGCRLALVPGTSSYTWGFGRKKFPRAEFAMNGVETEGNVRRDKGGATSQEKRTVVMALYVPDKNGPAGRGRGPQSITSSAASRSEKEGLSGVQPRCNGSRKPVLHAVATVKQVWENI